MRIQGLVTIAAALAAWSVAGVAIAQPMSAQGFVNAAAQSDVYEIASSQLVLAQSADPRVRAFAQQMLEEHRRTSADLAAAAAASRLPPPPTALSGDQQRMLNALQSLKGPDLDRSFMVQQVNAHAGALVTEQTYVANGADPNLRTAAQRAIPLVEHHLAMARQISAAMPPQP